MSTAPSVDQTLLDQLREYVSSATVWGQVRLARLAVGIIVACDMRQRRIAEWLDRLGLTQATTPESIERRLRRTLNDPAVRQSDADVVLFKSVGIAAEDVTVAELVVRRAREAGLGVELGSTR